MCFYNNTKKKSLIVVTIISHAIDQLNQSCHVPILSVISHHDTSDDPKLSIPLTFIEQVTHP